METLTPKESIKTQSLGLKDPLAEEDPKRKYRHNLTIKKGTKNTVQPKDYPKYLSKGVLPQNLRRGRTLQSTSDARRPLSSMHFDIYHNATFTSFLDCIQYLGQEFTTASLLPYLLGPNIKIYYSTTFNLFFGPQYEDLLQRHFYLIFWTLVISFHVVGGTLPQSREGSPRSLVDHNKFHS